MALRASELETVGAPGQDAEMDVGGFGPGVGELVLEGVDDEWLECSIDGRGGRME